MTLQLYAKRKQWDLRQVTVRLKHFRVHADDCMNCETHEGFLDRIDRDLELVGTLDDSQKQRLIEIAERCPVHRTLKSKIDIRTHLTPNK
jgi:putative redox protein